MTLAPSSNPAPHLLTTDIHVGQSLALEGTGERLRQALSPVPQAYLLSKSAKLLGDWS